MFHNDLKQVLEIEEMPQNTSAFHETICDILKWNALMPDRVKSHSRQTKVDLASLHISVFVSDEWDPISGIDRGGALVHN